MEYIIYKIVCNDLKVKDVYVGSTRQFTKRKYRHKYDCNNENSKCYNYKVYQTIRASGGWANWSMVKVEDCICETTLDARKVERHWFEKLNADMNMHYPQRNQKEYCKNNKQKIAEYIKEYYEQNKEKFAEYKKEYSKNNKQKIAEQGKDYREQNKQKIQEKKKEYREKNKQKIQEKNNQKFTCECGGCFTYINKLQHERSIKHQNYICNKNI